MAWGTSDRRSRLPADWPKIRRRILRRDGGLCVKCGDPANQVDHIEPGDDHSDENLQSLCESCHSTKSAAEGHQSQAKLRALLKRPQEEPPGSILPDKAVPRANRGF